MICCLAKTGGERSPSVPDLSDEKIRPLCKKDIQFRFEAADAEEDEVGAQAEEG